jgi:hypothetical protein
VKWRESLLNAIQQGGYAKDAKAPIGADDPTLLHLLHANHGEPQNLCSLDGDFDRESATLASAVLSRAGVRIMQLDGVTTIGVWSDLDEPEVRAALRTFGSEQGPVRYLDGPGIPVRYKLRRVEGEPVPLSVLAEMERHPADPWKIRDAMLKEMRWCRKTAAASTKTREREGTKRVTV